MTNRSRDYYRKMRKRTIAKRKRKIFSYRTDRTPKCVDSNSMDEYLVCLSDKEAKEFFDDYSLFKFGYFRPNGIYMRHPGRLSKSKAHYLFKYPYPISLREKRKAASMIEEIYEYSNVDSVDFYDSDYNDIDENNSLNISVEAANQITTKLKKISNFNKSYPNCGISGGTTHHPSREPFTCLADLMDNSEE